MLIQKLRRWILRRFVPEIVWPSYVILDGVKIAVRGMPYSFGVKLSLSKRQYEQSERTLLCKVIKPGCSVLEMGGSIGILATICVNKVGPEGRVVSVEAAEWIAAQTGSRLAMYPNVSVTNGFAFPVTSVPTSFSCGQFLDSGNTLGGRIDFAADAPALANDRVFDISRLQSEFAIAPDILLIDIEGSELVILEPTATIPECVKHIIIELHPDLYGDAKEKQIIAALNKLGFSLVEELKHVYLLTR